MVIISPEINHSPRRVLVWLKASVPLSARDRFIVFVNSAVSNRQAPHHVCWFFKQFWTQGSCQEFWYMTQPFTQITDQTPCQVNVPTLSKDWLKVKVNLFSFTQTCKASVISRGKIRVIRYIFWQFIHRSRWLEKQCFSPHVEVILL